MSEEHELPDESWTDDDEHIDELFRRVRDSVIRAIERENPPKVVEAKLQLIKLELGWRPDWLE